MRFKKARKLRDNEIAEINQILKAQGLNRRERRLWLKTIKKEARMIDL